MHTALMKSQEMVSLSAQGEQELLLLEIIQNQNKKKPLEFEKKSGSLFDGFFVAFSCEI